MSSLQPFGPNLTKTKSISVSNSSATATLDATDVSSTPTPANSGPSGGHSVMRIVNAGPSTVFLRWGLAASVGAASASTDMPMLSGTVEVFSKSADVDTVAAITSTSTSTVYITCGEGW